MIYYLISINIISFCLYGLDKFLAISRKYRISERCLLLISFFGGVFGSIIAMIIFRHKTKKLKFKINYVFLLLWIFVIIKRWYV